jgi:hypothetical protein
MLKFQEKEYLFTLMEIQTVIKEPGAIKELNRKFSQTSIETLYYNPGIHLGAFHMPRFIKERLK